MDGFCAIFSFLGKDNKIAVGCWLLAVGCWLLAVGCWQK